MTPTTALKRSASFNMARLEIPPGKFIEVLLQRVAPLRKVDLEIRAAGRPTRPQHRKHLPATSDGLVRCRASPERRAQAVQQLQTCEDPGRLQARDMNHPRSSWLSALHDHQGRDTKNSRRRTPSLHVSHHLEPERCKAEDSEKQRYPACPTWFAFR